MRDTNPYPIPRGGSWPPRPTGFSGPRRDARQRRAGGSWLRAVALLAVAAVAGWIAFVKVTEPRGTPSTPVLPQGAFAWPAAGVSAAGVSAAGFAPRLVAGPGARRPVPVASVAKLMTAYVIMRDHPLGAGAEGPQIVVRPDEAAAYPAQARNDESLVPVIAGERISERQALMALLLPSADNMAWILARWDAGSQQAFVARMNAAAQRLGMNGTRYTDASGLAASTVSTAADQVLLGRAVMAQPVLAGIVATRTAVVPVAGPVRNLNRLLGSEQIVGLKTGSTSAAGGCVLLAAWHRVSGHRVLIIAAVFGQPGPLSASLANALAAGRQLVLAVDHALDHPARAKSAALAETALAAEARTLGPGAGNWPKSSSNRSPPFLHRGGTRTARLRPLLVVSDDGGGDMPDRQSATGGGGQQEAADGYFGPLGPARYMLLTTFQPDGIPVSAHVHGMVHDGRAYFRAWDRSGTAQRLRHTDDVQVAPGRMPSLAVGPPLDAVARPLSGEEAGWVARELARKHPLQQRFIIPLVRWARRSQLAYYELLTYEAAASQDIRQEAGRAPDRHLHPAGYGRNAGRPRA